MPVYLLNWNVIPNYNIHGHDTRKATNILTDLTKYEFPKKCLKYNLRHIITDTPELVKKKLLSVYVGLVSHKNHLLQKKKMYVQFMIVTYVS